MALLYPEKVVDALTAELLEPVETGRALVKAGMHDSTTLKMEDLMAFETDRDAACGRSLASWVDLLLSWKIDVNVQTVRAFLEKRAGTRPAPASHRMSIFNFDEVHAALLKRTQTWQKPLAGYLRG